MSGMWKWAMVAGKVALGGGAAVAVAAAGGAAWVKTTSDAMRSARFETHAVDFPIPAPLELADVARMFDERVAAGADPDDAFAGIDLDAVARERAIERGRHLVEARYACVECHGADFGGGRMIDDPLIGHILAPNLTTGQGSRTLAYTPADWDRIVRHGVKPDGTPTPMPSKDFFAMSDRELSDIVTYIRSLPPVDAEVPAMTLGPLGAVLLATGQIELAATAHPDHFAAHAALPPAETPDAEFGEHVAQVCVGCHRADFTGGPIVGGDPSWPAAANLTALGDWTYEDFATTLREARRPDGTTLKPPMAGITKMTANMSETELRALWAFLQTRQSAPKPDGLAQR